MTEKKIKIRQQAFALTVCTVVFMIVYNVCTWYASSLPRVPSLTFDFEKWIPFVPLSIIPYMASAFFFCTVFFSCKNKYQLKILTWRMLFVTVIAGLFFILLPLQFSFTKPEVENRILRLPFSFLKAFDSPFNQSPSLHIAFAFVFWAVFKDISKWKNFFLVWLLLLGISTLTTYQHHLIDIVSGALLAHVSFIIIPYRKNDPEYRNLWLANYYFLIGWFFVAAALILHHFFSDTGLILLIPSLLTFILGYNCQKNNNIIFKYVLTVRQNILQFKKSSSL